MRYLVAILVASALAVPSASAGFYYDAKGKTVITDEPYDGPGMSAAEWALVSGSVGSMFVISNLGTNLMALYALPTAAVLGWGAWRTNHYRPSEVKAGIQRRLAQQAAAAQYGTIYTLPAY